MEIAGLLFPKDGKLGVSGSWLAVEVDSEVSHAPFVDSFDGPDELSPLMASSHELLSSFAFTFFLNFDLLF